MLKALQEARGARELQQQPGLDAKLTALGAMSLSNGSKVGPGGGVMRVIWSKCNFRGIFCHEKLQICMKLM